MRRLVTVAVLGWALTATATKPCPEDPCYTPGEFHAGACRALAKWIVVARLTAIRHQPQPAPVLKDFAEFEVQIEKWEKGQSTVEKLQFRVGWCDNSLPPPKQIGARMRIYGKGDPGAREPQYLGLEPLK
jgi:hypothetical protein